MTHRVEADRTPRVQAALSELQEFIASRFPHASFEIEGGFDPDGTYLVVTVDVADTDEVVDLTGDRLLEMQVDEGLPVYVMPLRPIARVIAQLHEQEPSPTLTPTSLA